MNVQIHEGGAAGHLSHVVEDLSLTFGDVKQIISTAGEGKLERASEKLDGINCVFSYDGTQLKVARSGGDIKRGGMDAAALAQKFFGRGNLEDAFNGAFKTLEAAMGSLPTKVAQTVFRGGTRWYSVEVLYAASPNVVNYDGNSIVFHGYPIFDSKGEDVERTDDASGVDLLSSRVQQMQKVLKSTGWRVQGPALVAMRDLSSGKVVNDALSAISSAMASSGCSDSDTMEEHLRRLMRAEVENSLNLTPELTQAVTERCIEADGAPTLTKLKGLLDKQGYPPVEAFVKSAPKSIKRMMRPIELAIHRFSIEVLRGLSSALVSDNPGEVQRIRASVTKAIDRIQSSGNADAIAILQNELERMGSVDDIVAATEGIVFFYKGQAYKFTGNFAPVNQILGLFKYGRGKVPPMSTEEMLLRRAVNRLVESCT